MKSRIWVTTIAVGFISASAYAAFTETGNTTSTSSTWTQVTTTVKTTVDRWMSYWSPKSETVVAPAAPVVVSAPESQPAGDTNTVDRARIEGTAPESVPVAEIAPAAEVSALKSQSLYESKATGSSLAEVRAARDGVRATQAFAVAKAGRAGTSKLGRDKSGVPVVDWKKLKAAKSIPRLDIGTESLISKSDFKVEKLSWGLSKPSDLKRLPGPAPIDPKITAKALAQPFAKAMGAKGLLANMRTVGQPISKEMVDKVQYNMVQVPDYQPLAYKPLSEEHMKMVAALILFEKGGSCHMIMGLFNQLATAEKTQAEATYHLGACADQLAMHQAAFDKLSELVVAEDDEFGKDALKLLAKDLPVIYEDDFAKIMKGLKNPKALISEESRDDVAYRFAKGAYRNGDFKLSGAQAELVSDKSPNKEDARFLSAMNSFALNDKPAALKKLQDLWASLEARKASNSNIRALTAVNLARMNFALKKYDKALEYYMQVPKDHALWVNALIEQGWTQLALEDFSGAIGNMYSLHSPYFKAVYQPESFVIRTIGYLNICQYGDAYKTLSWLEKDYRDWFTKTDGYLSTKHDPLEVYNTVKGYIKGKSTEAVAGVPYQVWREMARRKDFLNLQAALNDKQDETKRYEGVNEKIKTEKAGIRWRADQSKKQFDGWKAKIAKLKTDRGQVKELNQFNAGLKLEKERTIGYRFQLTMLEQSRQGYLEFQKKSQGKLDTESVTLARNAGSKLQKRADGMRTEMKRVLENNEFLRYEVFSGSGENIRYQVAGGEVSGTTNRIPASIRPAKMMNWNFDGEFWEDEIGSYRSSLTNACPQTAQTGASQEGDQAHLHKEE